jgi:uncharacterized RDD family membrane protein YckC
MGGGYGSVPQASTAEIGPRVIAGLIDLLAIPIGLSIVGNILGRVSGILGLLFLFVQLGYLWVYLPYTVGTTGQSIGKKSQNIKTVSADTGQPLGFGMAWVRYFINGIVCGLGWLLPFVDSQKQTLGDKVAKGVTVPA